MKSFLEKLKSKNPEEKKRFAFLSSVFLTILIFIIWFTAHNAINDLKGGSQEASPINPFADLKEVFGPLFSR